MELAERFQKERERRDISVNKAAQELDVQNTTFKAWERGWSIPDADKAERIAEWLGISKIDVLMMLGIVTLEDVRELAGAGKAPSPVTSQTLREQRGDGRRRAGRTTSLEDASIEKGEQDEEMARDFGTKGSFLSKAA